MKMRYRKTPRKDLIIIRGGKQGIVDRLFKWVVFYDTKALKILTAAQRAAAIDAVVAGKLLIEMGKVHDRMLDCMKNALPYITPRLQTLEINKKTTKRYVFRVPSQIKNSDLWLHKVKEEQKLIPKINVEKIMEEDNDAEDELDDLDYETDIRSIN